MSMSGFAASVLTGANSMFPCWRQIRLAAVILRCWHLNFHLRSGRRCRLDSEKPDSGTAVSRSTAPVAFTATLYLNSIPSSRQRGVTSALGTRWADLSPMWPRSPAAYLTHTSYLHCTGTPHTPASTSMFQRLHVPRSVTKTAAGCPFGIGWRHTKKIAKTPFLIGCFVPRSLGV
jgi:hypothetical protein